MGPDDGKTGAERTDDDLLTAWKTGNEAAGQALLSRHEPALRRFSRRTTADADDFVQETLSRVVATRDRIRSGPRFRAYILTIARNLLSELQRQQQRGLGPSTTPAAEASPSQTLAKLRQLRLLSAALKTLAKEQQTLLQLHYWKERSVSEMAAMLNVPEGTVKSRLFASRNQLRRALEATAGGPALFDNEPTGFDAWIRKISRVGAHEEDD
ncbi:MAG: sigma-70 family RNA polymerase sigma factor [Nannocystaceae bacterium]|nr:sigma-70 family RNA polymerase sigma factor [Nannocystaceae bacterium]